MNLDPRSMIAMAGFMSAIMAIVLGAGFLAVNLMGLAVGSSTKWARGSLHASLLYISQDAADADQPTFGFTAQFGSRIAGDIPAPNVGLRGGVRVRVGESVLEVVADNSVGYFFQNVA